MIERTREGLVALLIEHQHSYDSDCGADNGCSCGWGPETWIERDDSGQWQDAAFAEHLASILRGEPQPVIPQHEDIARKKREEAERRAAAFTPEHATEARSKALVLIEGGEGGAPTVTVHPDAKVFIEGELVMLWGRLDDRPVTSIVSPDYADLIRKALSADDSRWATREEVRKLGRWSATLNVN